MLSVPGVRCVVCVSHCCDRYRYELPFPHIAAGDNLNLAVLGSFFRHRHAALAATCDPEGQHSLYRDCSGSFFIKRKSGGKLYRRVLQVITRPSRPRVTYPRGAWACSRHDMCPQAYLRVLLRGGRSVEFFLEGGRSRYACARS